MAPKRVPQTIRHNVILRELHANGHVSVVDIAERLGVSDMTVRRDLDLLEEEKLVVRTHGGAKLPEAPENRILDPVEPSVAHRATRYRAQKQAIARKALELLRPGTTVALDVGTTTIELAALLSDTSIRVVSTSLPIQTVLAERNMTVYAPCGQLSSTEPSVVGAQTIGYLHNTNFDIAFLGIAGITERGLHDYSFEDAEIKKALIAQSGKSVLLADSSKFGALSAIWVCAFDGIDMLVTDHMPPDSLRLPLEASGAEIVIAQ